MDYSILDCKLDVPLLGTSMKKTIHTDEYALLVTLLRETRESAGLTQIELALRLNTTQSIVSKIERGERRLDLVELKAWCDAIDVSLAHFAARFEQACDSRDKVPARK